jgi:hypothetical protein
MLTSRGYSFEVDFATDFKSLVELRDKMLIFLQENRRDYMPVFDGTYMETLAGPAWIDADHHPLIL